MSQIVVQLFEDCKHHSITTKGWLALAIGYAITVGRIIKNREIAYMNALMQSMDSDPELALIKNKILQNHQPSFHDSEIPNFDKQTTELLLKCIIQICTVDRQIQHKEFQYIQKIGFALGFSSNELHHRVSHLIGGDAHSVYFDQLIANLSYPEKKWLALAIFRLSYIIKKPLKPHLAREACLFLGNRHELLEECQEHAQNDDLFILPKVSLTCEKANSALMYLLKLLASHCGVHGKGLLFLEEIMHTMNMNPNQWCKLLNSVRTNEFLSCSF